MNPLALHLLLPLALWRWPLLGCTRDAGLSAIGRLVAVWRLVVPPLLSLALVWPDRDLLALC